MSATEFELLGEFEDAPAEEALELAPLFARGGAVKFRWPSRVGRWAQRPAFAVDFGDELEEELMELEPLFLRGGSITHPYKHGQWRQEFNNTTWALPEFEDKPACKLAWAIWGFDPGKEKPGQDQEVLVKKMVTDIGSMLKRELNGKSATVILRIHFEGHVDRTSDPADFGTLDDDRASWVWMSVLNEIDNLERLAPGVQLVKSFSKSRAGASRPFKTASGVPPRPPQNRRVSVCINWELKPLSTPQKKPSSSKRIPI
jgi:hypothetical protein